VCQTTNYLAGSTSSVIDNILVKFKYAFDVVVQIQLSISQKAVGTLPEDGNVMPKHVGDTMHN
jgi:hypothetical protein